MSWEAVSAIGEILGALAVLITLIYLAVQIRYVRSQVESDTLGHVVSALNDFAGRIADSGELSEILVQGKESSSRLSASDKYRYDQTFFFLLNILQSWYLQIDQLKLYSTSDQNMGNIKVALLYYCDNPGFREHWPSIRNMYPYLCEYVEETLRIDA